MIYEVRKVNVWSVAKVSFVLGGVLGFCGGLFLWMFAGLLSQLPMSELGEPEAMEGLSNLGAMMPFVLGVLYAVLFMIMNSLLVGAYNLLVGLVGGVELTLVPPPPADMPVAHWAPPGPPPSGWTQTPPPPPAPPGPPATPGG